jgi:extracellular elastinolytic metalloproteinase
MLWIVSQRMIAKHGFIDSLFPPLPLEDGTIPIGDFYRSPETLSADAANHLVPKHGNSLMVQLVINGMKLQQCRPGFFEARDAIIQADQVLTGGENFCDLWLAFAERGLGVDATVQGRTPWGGGVRKDVSTFFYMSRDVTSLNIYRCRVPTSRLYAVPRRSQSLLRNHHQTKRGRPRG